MAQEIYHRSNWGNPTETWGNTYLNADLTNELYKRASEYENSWVTDQLLNGVGIKPSIILTPTAYEDGVLNSVKPAKTFGSELVTNGTFDTDSDWTLGTGATIENGLLNFNNVNNDETRQLNLFPTPSLGTYVVSFDISNYVSGHIDLYLGGFQRFNFNADSNGTWTRTCVITNPSSNNIFYFIGDNFTGSIDNVSVKEVIDADFDFTRGSSATRVNELGLVEDVQILSGELVQNGDFEQSSDNVLVGNNSTFDSGVGDWVSYGAGTLIHNTNKLEVSVTASEGGAMIPTNSLFTGGQSGKLIKVRVQLWLGTMTNTNFKVFIGGVQENVTLSSTPTYYDFYLKPTSSSNLIIYKGNIVGSSGTFFIDNISVKEVGQNWTFGIGWSMGDGKAISDGSANNDLRYETTFNPSILKIKFDVNDLTQGSVRLFVNTPTFTQLINATSNGSYETTVEVTSGANNLYFYSTNNFIGSIDNVSVIEITDDTDLPRINYTNFDYENGEVVPYSGEGSLLLEPQSTNLITYSEEFSNASWFVNNGTLTINQKISPKGDLTADKIVFGSGGGTPFIDNDIDTGSTIASKDFTFSLYVYSEVEFDTWLRIRGLGTTTEAENITVNIKKGWNRVSATKSFTSSADGNSLKVALFDLNLDFKTLFIWGAQLEQGSYPTSYIPTNGSTVTRLADVCNNSGSSDLINSTEGVLYAEISALANDGTVRYFGLNDGSNNNRAVFLFDSAANRVRAIVSSGGTKYVDFYYTVTDLTEFHKIALKYKADDFSLWVDGVERNTDTSGLTPIGLDNLEFDLNLGGALYGNVKCVAVFKEALSDTELQKLTTI